MYRGKTKARQVVFHLVFLSVLWTGKVRAGLITSPPWGFSTSMEIEKNVGFTNTSQDWLQNWSFSPRYDWKSGGKYLLKLNFGFGYSLVKPIQYFLYDAQVRFEVADVFSSSALIFKWGTWLYGPVSKVSRNDSVIVSLRTWLQTGGKIVVRDLTWTAELSYRYWWDQFSEPNPNSTHPQQRSGLHEISRNLKNQQLTDRMAVHAKLGTILSFRKIFSRFFLRNLWISMDAHFRWARTYSGGTLSLPADQYTTLLVYQSAVYAISRDIYLDFTIQHSGRFRGPNKIKFFGDGTTYYFGVNFEL